MLSQTEWQNSFSVWCSPSSILRYYSRKSKWTYARWWIGRGGSNLWSPWPFLMTFLSGTTYILLWCNTTWFDRCSLTFRMNIWPPFSGSKSNPSKWPGRSRFCLLSTCLTCSSALKIEAVCSSETLVNFYWITWCYITEDTTLHSHCCENLLNVKISDRPFEAESDHWGL
jgi:hypothetical protein